ncbi:MAG TPA: hypothetical protein DCP02_00945 [Actinobacteria bacterium]|nr:hypothetical protein [Actinomycetota bacterium]
MQVLNIYFYLDKSFILLSIKREYFSLPLTVNKNTLFWFKILVISIIILKKTLKSAWYKRGIRHGRFISFASRNYPSTRVCG